jgi:hypothetical protein
MKTHVFPPVMMRMSWMMRWERATPMALFMSITQPMSAIGVARFQP